MSDEADVGNDNAELFLRAALNAQSKRHDAGLLPMMQCYYCLSPVGSSLLFCPGNECRDDYQCEQRIKRIKGQ